MSLREKADRMSRQGCASYFYFIISFTFAVPFQFSKTEGAVKVCLTFTCDAPSPNPTNPLNLCKLPHPPPTTQPTPTRPYRPSWQTPPDEQQQPANKPITLATTTTSLGSTFDAARARFDAKLAHLNANKPPTKAQYDKTWDEAMGEYTRTCGAPFGEVIDAAVRGFDLGWDEAKEGDVVEDEYQSEKVFDHFKPEHWLAKGKWKGRKAKVEFLKKKREEKAEKRVPETECSDA